MLYDRLESFNDSDFQRYTGVKRSTFDDMLNVLVPAHAKKRLRGGPQPKLVIENQLLLALAYWREYRSFFHIGGDFDVSESTAQRITEWVENTLMQSGKFTLPKREEWQEECTDIEVVLVDATEVECERPKKNSGSTTRGRKRDTR